MRIGSFLARIVGITAFVLVLVVAAGLVIYGYETKPGWVGVADKTLWDWLKLLIVPAVLALASIWFTHRRAVIDREIARRHAEDGELRTYFEQMGKLLLGQDTPRQICLREARPESDIHYLARAWTTSTLEKLTGENRKRRLLRFLYESHLIEKDKPVVNLARARLKEVNLEDAILKNADLRGAWLQKAKLKGADLSKATLATGEIEDTPSETKLIGADLRDANLTDADLRGVDLTGADLRGVDLSGADLRGVFKRRKYGLKKLITNKELEKELERRAKSLKGATMPNGQKYEDWLKSKGRKPSRKVRDA